MVNKMRQKGADEIFCRSCGELIKKEAEICPHCGVRQRKHFETTKTKSKKVAVLLAIFLGFWTWCYTYKKNSTKFWIGLIINALLFWTIVVPIGIEIWAIIDSATKEREWYEQYYK